MNTAPRTLGDIFAPRDPEEFIQRILGKAYGYFPGRRGKFSPLLTWPALNNILDSHQLDVPRLRLSRDGKVLPAESFISYRESRRPGAARLSRLRSSELTKQLREGATLILDAIDEIHPPITDLATNLERSLRSRVQVNLYAGWRTSPGFDVHWDGHDVIILQISGRKHWKVYSMTREFPLADDPKTEKPPEHPLWEGMLEDGDLLYIPRGWWHVAIPVDEPTLHLTVGVHRPTGLDFASWFVDRLRTNVAFRQDIPSLETVPFRQEHFDKMRAAWQGMWEPGLLDEYLAYVDARSRFRMHFGLPWQALPDVIPADERGWNVHWLVARPIESADGKIRVRGNGREFTFAAEALPLLAMLEESGLCTIEDVYSRVVCSMPKEQIRLFLKELVDAGLAAIDVPTSPRQIEYA